jgi:isopenicillin-N epimerase
MNDVAHSFPLSADDEVLINDHEYGAVQRIWRRKCQQVGARLVTVQLPLSATLPDQITKTILEAVTARTKLVIVSHITSPTAIILPVQQLCAQLKQRGVPICIDGPHALLQQPFKLHTLECDFYTASCHKWLCAPLGSGFVYVAPPWQAKFAASRLSWGRLQPAQPQSWSDEMLWTGTRDYSAYLCVPKAIDFFQQLDWHWIDQRNHALACYAREQISRMPGAEAVTPEGREWFGWMVAVWLPEGDHSTLQRRLWERYRIEVPIVHFANRWLVRMSCHLYNTSADIDRLQQALKRELSGN